VIPGGFLGAILMPDQLDTQASFDAIQKAGSLLGSAAIVVLDDTTCMVWLAENLLHFYRHESCGQVHAVPRGHRLAAQILRASSAGKGRCATSICWRAISGNIAARRCAPSATPPVTPVLTTLKHFRHEYEAHIKRRTLHAAADWRARQPVGVALTTMRSRKHESTKDTNTRKTHRRGSSFSCLSRVSWFRSPSMTPLLLAQIALTLFVFVMLLSSAAGMVYVERKVAALLQQRSTVSGRLQGPAAAARRRHQADVPRRSCAARGRSHPLRAGADHLGGTRGVLAFAVVPVRRRYDVLRAARRAAATARSDVNVAVLVIFAIASMGVYGIVLAAGARTTSIR